jgi:hypothetical protein
MHRVTVGLLLSASLALGLVATPAAADSWTWRDRGGDARVLSIRSISASHQANGPALTITFDRALRPSQMGRRDFIVVDVDSDGRGKSDQWIYLVSIRGRLRRFSYNPRTDTVHPIAGYTFSRPTPRSVRLSLSDFVSEYSVAMAVGSYTETAPGCAGGCWDTVPNRGRLIHDWTAPQILAVTEPNLWNLLDYVRFTWETRDYGLSGFKRSTLLRGEPGSGRWEPVQVRTEPGRYRLRVPVEQGANVLLRPVAQDGARNKTMGPIRRVRVPYDQSNPEGPGTFSGQWAEADEEYAYGGTVHTSTAPAAALSFSGRGNVYCFHGRWGQEPVDATFEAGGETVEINTFPGGSAPPGGQPVCITLPSVEDRVATLTVDLGRLSVDWYWEGIGDGNGYDPPSRKVAERPVESGTADGMSTLRALRAGARSGRRAFEMAPLRHGATGASPRRATQTL